MYILNERMLSHSFGGAVILLSLHHFIAPALDLMPCLPSDNGGRCYKSVLGRGGLDPPGRAGKGESGVFRTLYPGA